MVKFHDGRVIYLAAIGAGGFGFKAPNPFVILAPPALAAFAVNAFPVPVPVSNPSGSVLLPLGGVKGDLHSNPFLFLALAIVTGKQIGRAHV